MSTAQVLVVALSGLALGLLVECAPSARPPPGTAKPCERFVVPTTPEVDLVALLGTRVEGSVPRMLAGLRRGDGPEEVKRRFPATVESRRDAKLYLSLLPLSVRGVASVDLELDARGLRGIDIEFASGLRQASFVDALSRTMMAKYGAEQGTKSSVIGSVDVEGEDFQFRWYVDGDTGFGQSADGRYYINVDLAGDETSADEAAEHLPMVPARMAPYAVDLGRLLGTRDEGWEPRVFRGLRAGASRGEVTRRFPAATRHGTDLIVERPGIVGVKRLIFAFDGPASSRLLRGDIEFAEELNGTDFAVTLARACAAKFGRASFDEVWGAAAAQIRRDGFVLRWTWSTPYPWTGMVFLDALELSVFFSDK